MFLGCENEVVVLVAQRLEGGPVDSRVGAFPEVMTHFDLCILSADKNFVIYAMFLHADILYDFICLS